MECACAEVEAPQSSRSSVFYYITLHYITLHYNMRNFFKDTFYIEIERELIR